MHKDTVSLCAVELIVAWITLSIGLEYYRCPPSPCPQQWDNKPIPMLQK